MRVLNFSFFSISLFFLFPVIVNGQETESKADNRSRLKFGFEFGAGRLISRPDLSRTYLGHQGVWDKNTVEPSLNFFLDGELVRKLRVGAGLSFSSFGLIEKIDNTGNLEWPIAEEVYWKHISGAYFLHAGYGIINKSKLSITPLVRLSRSFKAYQYSFAKLNDGSQRYHDIEPVNNVTTFDFIICVGFKISENTTLTINPYGGTFMKGIGVREIVFSDPPARTGILAGVTVHL